MSQLHLNDIRPSAVLVKTVQNLYICFLMVSLVIADI